MLKLFSSLLFCSRSNKTLICSTRECVFTLVCIATIGFLRVMKWAVSNARMDVIPIQGFIYLFGLSIYTLWIVSSWSTDSCSKWDSWALLFPWKLHMILWVVALCRCIALWWWIAPLETSGKQKGKWTGRWNYILVSVMEKVTQHRTLTL